MKHKPSASLREISSLKPTQPSPPPRSNRASWNIPKNANCGICAHINRASRSSESVIRSRKSEVSSQSSVISSSSPKDCCRSEELDRVGPSIRAINIARSAALCPSGEQRHLCIFREQSPSAFYFIPFYSIS